MFLYIILQHSYLDFTFLVVLVLVVMLGLIFFIAASLAFGIYTAKISIMVRQKEQFFLPFCRFFNYAATPLAAGMIMSGILANQFIIGHYLSQDGIIESSTIATIQRIQAILILGGMILTFPCLCRGRQPREGTPIRTMKVLDR